MGAVEERFADLPQLAAVLSLDLYRDNPFRLLGVPTTASMGEIHHRQRRPETQQPLPMAGEPAAEEGTLVCDRRDADKARRAMERLADPRARIIAELFWFWPLSEGPELDPALNALGSGDYGSALGVWKSVTDRDQVGIALHNRVVLTHYLALECERPAMGLGAGLARVPVTRDAQARLDGLWDAALSGWLRSLNDAQLWARLKQRLSMLGGDRGSEAFVSSLRVALPQALCEIGALVADALAQQGDLERAAAHAARLRGLGESAGDTPEAALRGVLQRVSRKLEAAVRTASDGVLHHPSAGQTACDALLNESEPLLAQVRALLEPADPMRSKLHDQVADAAIQCAVAYGYAGEDWQGALSLLERTQQIGASDAAEARLRRERAGLEEARRRGLCFFCGELPYQDGDALVVHLHGEVVETPIYAGDLTQQSTRLQWKSAKARVPRCPRCRRVHDCRLAEEARTDPPQRPDPLPRVFEIPYSGRLFAAAVVAAAGSGLLITLLADNGLPVPFQLSMIFALSVVAGVFLPIVDRWRTTDRRERAAHKLRLAAFRRELAGYKAQKSANARLRAECANQRKANPDDWLRVPAIEAYSDYPPIRDLQQEGWQLGKKPPGARKGSEDADVFGS
jgi:hypothetical protein